jgi:GlpG protein
MRQAGILPANFDAERFADYLLTLGIKTRVDASGEGQIVWIKDEKDLERGRTELAAFMANPDDPRYKLAEDGARTIRKELEARDEQFRNNVVNVRRGWSQPITAKAPATMTLLVICVVVGLTMWMVTGEATMQGYLGIAPVGPSIPLSSPDILIQVRGGELWRLVTPIFLHFGGFHLLFNLLMLQNMGTLIESREGTARFLGFVFLSALISNVAQYFVGELFNLAFWRGAEFTQLMANPNFGGMS